MKTTCCETQTETCVTDKLEWPRYFPGQLITDADLSLGMEYVRNRLRLRTRMMHGWGVVCGLRVRATEEAWTVVIDPGYALGPWGDEIYVDQTVKFDLRRSEQGGETALGVDPFCSDVKVEPREDKLYVAIRYKLVESRLVRVQPAGCGCDDTACEYSRWVDCYEFGTRTDCPEKEQMPATLEEVPSCELVDCPPCPKDPWVVLACVRFDADGKITGIDNCDCRRIVRTLAPYWCRCTEDADSGGRTIWHGIRAVSTLQADRRAAPGVSKKKAKKVAAQQKKTNNNKKTTTKKKTAGGQLARKRIRKPGTSRRKK